MNRDTHERVILQFLQELNQETDAFILKGGTALRQCYGLDRFSEDIDLDATAKNIFPFSKKFCTKNGYTFRVAKDTETVKRLLLHYGEETENPLKIEVSYRQKTIPKDTVTRIGGITVYTLDRIASMKTAAYIGRDKIRDLYDIVYICNHHFAALSQSTKNLMTDAFAQKGIEAFEYLMETEQDPLIDKNKLVDDFLTALDRLHILYEKKD